MNDIHSTLLLIVVLGMAKGYDDIYIYVFLVYSGNNLVVVVAVREL